MKVIGITGGSGAGKSLACRFLLSRGGMLIDCDKVYASLVDVPSHCTEALSKAFGKEILTSDGALNRSKLSSMVFKSENKEKLRLLNETVHPIVINEVKKVINSPANENAPYVLVDAPQLFESGADRLCDYTVYVTADTVKRIERIITRDNIKLDAAERRLASQFSEEYFKSKCDFTVYNNGTEEELAAECSKLLDRLGIQQNGTAK